MNPKYPVYIVSKGRWDKRLTANSLDLMGVPYKIIVELQEYSKYREYVPDDKLLILPKRYLERYDTFDDLGDTKSKGPGAARNFAWDHSISLGYDYHWVMDDNIEAFGRINRNLYIPVTTGTIFRCAEDFVTRYENVYLSGFNYDFFAKTRTKLPAFVKNTRIYSCLFVKNDCSFRWRGRYNEDTDLSLRILKNGDCTIQFNAFIQQKATTQTIKGGNTKEFYEKEGTLPKSQMLVDMHPDVAKVVWRFNRWHHQVSYKDFKSNQLIRKKSYFPSKKVDNYGMKVVKIK
jgi:hypothetical protein